MNIIEQSIVDKGFLKRNVNPDSVHRQLIFPRRSSNAISNSSQRSTSAVILRTPQGEQMLWGDTNSQGIVWGDVNNKHFRWGGNLYTHDPDIKSVSNINNIFLDKKNILFDELSVEEGSPLPLLDWKYRKPIVINNPNSGELQGFSVCVKLDSTNFDFSKAKSDGSDLRFTLSNGVIRIPYWIESYDSSNEKAVVWIRVDLSVGDNTFYMYYGNPSASSESDGDSVFEFFDDFNGAELDMNKWQHIDLYHNGLHGQYSVSNGVLSTTGQTSDDDTDGLVSKTVFGPAIILESKAKLNLQGNNEQLGLVYSADNEKNNYVARYTNGGTDYELISKISGSSSVNSDWIDITADSNWHRLKIIFDGSNHKFFVDGVDVVDWQNSDLGAGYVGVWMTYNGKTEYDWFFARKFADQEPTVTCGTEEHSSFEHYEFYILKGEEPHYKKIKINWDDSFNNWLTDNNYAVKLFNGSEWVTVTKDSTITFANPLNSVKVRFVSLNGLKKEINYDWFSAKFSK